VPASKSQPQETKNYTLFLDALASLFVKVYSSVVKAADLYEQEKGRLVFLSPAKLREVFPLYERLIVERASELELLRE